MKESDIKTNFKTPVSLFSPPHLTETDILPTVSPPEFYLFNFGQRACFGMRKPRYGRYFDGCQ
jgi:hypothetical protein